MTNPIDSTSTLTRSAHHSRPRLPASTPPSAIALTLLLSVLVGVITTATNPLPLVLTLWLLAVLLTFLPFWLERSALSRSTPDLFRPLLLSALLSVVGIVRPLVIAFNQWETVWISDPSRVATLLTEALTLSVIAQAFLLLGYYLSSGRLVASLLPALPSLTRHHARAITATFIALSTLALAWWSAQHGGVANILNSLSDRRLLQEGSGYVALLIQLPLPAVWIWIAFGHRRTNDWAITLPLLCGSVLLLIPLGGRGNILRLLLGSAIIWHYRVAPIKTSRMFIFGLIGLLFISLASTVRTQTRDSQFRDAVQSAAADTDVAASLAATLGESGAGTDRLLLFLAGVPEKVPFQYGRTYLWLPSNVIPRALWHDKPGVSEANAYSSLFGVTKGIYPAGMVGDYYLQCGPVCVIAGATMTGSLLRGLWCSLNRDSTNSIIYAAGLLAFSGGIRNLNIQAFFLTAGPAFVAAHATILLRPRVAR